MPIDKYIRKYSMQEFLEYITVNKMQDLNASVVAAIFEWWWKRKLGLIENGTGGIIVYKS